MKYLLIDGNNLGVRNAFANAELKNKDGVSTGAIFGVFQSLNALKKKYPDHQFLVVWDSKSKRRIEESSAGVKIGLVPEAYKENRIKDEMPRALKDFYEQLPFLQKGIWALGIPQVRIQDFEADDVIAAYTKLLKKDNEIVIVTSDMDYYQILDQNVTIYDGMKEVLRTLQSFREQHGLTPSQWVDVGALMGDTSDNIFSVPGFGEKTAVEEIQKYGTVKKVMEAYEEICKDFRRQYPDLKAGDIDAFNVLKDAKTEKKTIIYPKISIGMPYLGVLHAFHNKNVKVAKTIIMALVFQERVKLAYSLKKMDDEIPNLPEVKSGEFQKEKLTEFFNYYDIVSLSETFSLFGGVDMPQGVETEF